MKSIFSYQIRLIDMQNTILGQRILVFKGRT